jgi:hypothetical protein
LQDTIVYLEVHRTNHRDNSARYIWAAIAGVFVGRDSSLISENLGSLLADVEFFHRIERKYVDFEGFPPSSARESDVLELELRSFQKEHSSHRPSTLPTSSRVTSGSYGIGRKHVARELVVLIPHREASFHEFTDMINGPTRFAADRSSYFVYGPGFHLFTNEPWDGEMIKQVPLIMQRGEPTSLPLTKDRPQTSKTLVTNIETCEVTETYSDLGWLKLLRPSERYNVEVVIGSTKNRVIYRGDNLLSIGDYLESEGWKTNIAWREQPIFPRLWYRAIR